MSSDPTYVRSTIVPVLGLVALGLFGLNFATFVSNLNHDHHSGHLTLCEADRMEAEAHLHEHAHELDAHRMALQAHRAELAEEAARVRINVQNIERRAEEAAQAHQVRIKTRHVQQLTATATANR